MVTLDALWLPIVLSAVFVFVVSSIIHMVIQWHKSDCKKMPNEDKVLDALRAHGVPPGEYVFPMAGSMKEYNSPEMMAKFQRGPVGWVLVRPPGGISMGKSLAQWFLYCLVVSVFVAYITSHARPAGPHQYLEVFQIAGAVAVAIYALSNVMNSIWKGVSWGSTVKYVIDGIIYGLVTAGTFGWLWPKA
jgi:hypothetical protein